jgi:hypothetical protein
MSISIFPTPTLSIPSSLPASTFTVPSANTAYQAIYNFEVAVYTITCVSGTVATIEFYNGPTTFIGRAVTVSGTVTFNLATAADRVRLFTDTGSNILLTFTKTSVALPGTAISGPVDTITATGTYTGTSTSGFGYVLAVGGGGAGGAGAGSSTGGAGGGGGAGGIGGKVFALTGSIPVTIGAAGAINAGAGGTTTFGDMSAGGGGGGLNNFNDGYTSRPGGAGGGTTNAVFSATPAAGGTGGAPCCYQGISDNTGPGVAITSPYQFVKTGSTGSGGGGRAYSGAGGAGQGSGIGTGGNGGSSGGGGTNGSNGTGFGAGGGGGGSNPARNGGAGTQGVVYVLKF